MLTTIEVWHILRPVLPGYSLSVTVIWCIVFAVLSGWYSGLETGLYRFNRLRGKLLARSGSGPAAKIERFFEDQRLLICIFLIGTNLWNYLAVNALITYYTQHGRSAREAELYTTLVLSPIFFIFAETVPKSWFYRQPTTLMLRSVRIITLSYWLIRFTGLGYLLRRLSSAMLILARQLGRGEPAADGDDLSYLLRESHAAGVISSVQTGIAERILALPEQRVWRMMIPIDRVFALPLAMPRDDFIRAVNKSPFACVPLYRDHPHQIAGLVNTDKLIGQPGREPSELLEPAVNISPETTLLSVLNVMRHDPARIAVVVDRRDRAIGIVTIADLVEYLLG